MQYTEISERYLRFAHNEARGQSPIYEQLAQHVAHTPSALTFLSQLPKDRQQPNLLFAALRFAGGEIIEAHKFDDALHTHQSEVAHLMRTRTTQTNEPGRCAALMPVRAQLEGPLALIEVGASAGLCLLRDAYGYDWGHGSLPAPTNGPVFPCSVNDQVPLPTRQLDIQWRMGLDLNPLDVTSDDDVAWLEHLVWPEHHDRLARLKSAIKVAQRNPPEVRSGDLLHDLPDVLAAIPAGLQVVVFHTAVLAYVADETARLRFAEDMVKDNQVTWISNEGHRVFPQITKRARDSHEDMFLISQDGEPVAWAAPHGHSLHWL